MEQGVAAGIGFDPFGSQSQKAIAEPEVIRAGQADAGEADVDVAGPGGDREGSEFMVGHDLGVPCQLRGERIDQSPAVGRAGGLVGNLFDVDARSGPLGQGGTEVQQADAVDRADEKTATSGRGIEAFLQGPHFAVGQPVGRQQMELGQESRPSLDEADQPVPRHGDQPVRGSQPDAVVRYRAEIVDDDLGKAVGVGCGVGDAIPDVDDGEGTGRSPQVALGIDLDAVDLPDAFPAAKPDLGQCALLPAPEAVVLRSEVDGPVRPDRHATGVDRVGGAGKEDLVGRSGFHLEEAVAGARKKMSRERFGKRADILLGPLAGMMKHDVGPGDVEKSVLQGPGQHASIGEPMDREQP